MPPPTDLEALIQHLAGRGDPAGRRPGTSVAGSLHDPTSDVSQLLDLIRRKTRAILDDPDDPDAPGSGPPPVARPSPRLAASRGLILGLAVAVGSMLATGLGGFAAYRALDRAAAARAAASDATLLAAIRGLPDARPAAPRDVDLGAIAATIAQLGDRLDHLDRGLASLVRSPGPEPRPDPPGPAPVPPGPSGDGATSAPANPQVAALAADLATVRRELGLGEAATARQVQEMRTVLQELNTVVRRVLSRPPADNTANITGPLAAVAVQALANNLQHPSAQVRGEAVEQLVRIGAPARGALPALQHRLNLEPDPNVRSAIQTALNVIGSR